jgi:hypothetical protein
MRLFDRANLVIFAVSLDVDAFMPIPINDWTPDNHIRREVGDEFSSGIFSTFPQTEENDHRRRLNDLEDLDVLCDEFVRIIGFDNGLDQSVSG